MTQPNQPPPLCLAYAPLVPATPPVAKLTVLLNADGQVCSFTFDAHGSADAAVVARAAMRVGLTSVAAAVPGVVCMDKRRRPPARRKQGASR